jgi:hypothetical protein
MSTSREFQLSRIYAEGWKAAGKLTMDETAALTSESVAARNPYTNEADRARWRKGFEQAQSTTDTLRFCSVPGSGANKVPQ